MGQAERHGSHCLGTHMRCCGYACVWLGHHELISKATVLAVTIMGVAVAAVLFMSEMDTFMNPGLEEEVGWVVSALCFPPSAHYSLGPMDNSLSLWCSFH